MTDHQKAIFKLMKNLILLLISMLNIPTSNAQGITGQWNAVVNIQEIQRGKMFDARQAKIDCSAMIHGQDQGPTHFPAANITFSDPKTTSKSSNSTGQHQGKFRGDLLAGISKKVGQGIPKRPQDPTPPYPYTSEEVTFENLNANVTLSGTLTYPKDGADFPVVILISGSGPQNRDGELFGHKPFLLISDYLTKNGIAVLRYDDRGFGESTGDFPSATSADFATDVESAIAYLKTRKEISKNNIGLVGHSEGGLIAPMVASKSKDVSFIVLLAGPGLPGYDIILRQTELIKRADGIDESTLQTELAFIKDILDGITNRNDSNEAEPTLKDSIQKQMTPQSGQLSEEMNTVDMIKYLVTYTTPWVHFFSNYDPSTSLANVRCPVLAINGEKDLQVPPKENLTAIENALIKGGNKNVTIKEFTSLNHLFQEAQTGSPAEYSSIEQTFSPAALEEIRKWIKKQLK